MISNQITKFQIKSKSNHTFSKYTALIVTYRPACRQSSTCGPQQCVWHSIYQPLFINTFVEHTYTTINKQKNKHGAKSYNNAAISAQCVIKQPRTWSETTFGNKFFEPSLV